VTTLAADSRVPASAARRSSGARVLLCGFAAVAVAGFVALGIWQLHRLSWKLDLIAQIDQRVHAPAVAAPGPAEWSSVDAARDAYRHVSATGTLLPGDDTLVQAVTNKGAGFWVMTPLRTDAGFTVLVNRGFVPADDKQAQAGAVMQSARPTTVTGLVRITEPHGGFLRSNDPGANRWFSRDVAAIAQARGLSDVAPYFIDADATPAGSYPVGGLTVVDLPNNHLQYALTWFAMAALLAGAMVYVVRTELKPAKS
jgi:surfeit locus 1 family protein